MKCTLTQKDIARRVSVTPHACRVATHMQPTVARFTQARVDHSVSRSTVIGSPVIYSAHSSTVALADTSGLSSERGTRVRRGDR